MSTQVKLPVLLFVIGTRPEAIKLAPVILMARRSGVFSVRVCATGQHRELLDSVLHTFAITPDTDLEVMTFDQTPAAVCAGIIDAIGPVIERERPQWVVVQGDTVSTFASSLAAFYAGAPVAHVEAGLRTGNRDEPWPEEMNRRLTAGIATLHFAPTERARENLLREGVPSDAIEVTGNTIVDAVQLVVEQFGSMPQASLERIGVDTDASIVLVTAHRRENLGPRLAGVFDAIFPILDGAPDAVVAIVGHRNPNVRAAIDAFAGRCSSHPRLKFVEPLDYPEFIDVLRRSHIVMTDSGGVQEEAPIFGKPVLVLRDVTERPELIDAGAGIVVGTGSARIASECIRLLRDPVHYASMSRADSLFGDGRASERIVQRLCAESPVNASVGGGTTAARSLAGRIRVSGPAGR